jgi:hypothetical protein
MEGDNMSETTPPARYPSAEHLTDIAGSFKHLAAILRQHWAIYDATVAENPWRLSVSSRKFVWNGQGHVPRELWGELLRDIVEVADAHRACKKLIADIVPGGEFDDYRGPGADMLPKGVRTPQTGAPLVTGWPVAVSRLIRSLQVSLKVVEDALTPDPPKRYYLPVEVEVVNDIAAAADLLARESSRRGPEESGTAQERKVAETARYVFHFHGAVYDVRFEDESGRIDAALAGAGYICRLLQQPRIALKATELIGAVASLDSGQADQAQNQESLRKLRKRRTELMQDLPASNAPEYPVEYEEVRPEVEEIDAEIRHLTGLGGKARRNRPNDSARVTATKSIRLVIDKCRTEYSLPRLAEHLDEHIHTGVECIYSPPDPLPIWQF